MSCNENITEGVSRLVQFTGKQYKMLPLFQFEGLSIIIPNWILKIDSSIIIIFMSSSKIGENLRHSFVRFIRKTKFDWIRKPSYKNTDDLFLAANFLHFLSSLFENIPSQILNMGLHFVIDIFPRILILDNFLWFLY